jgi:hypothetical protein
MVLSIFTSAMLGLPCNFPARPKAYLEQVPECRIAAVLAAAEGARRNPGWGVGNPGESADASRIGDKSALAGVTWMTRAEPRSLSWP